MILRLTILASRSSLDAPDWDLAKKELSRYLGVDPSTLRRWEHGKGQPLVKYRERVMTFLSGQVLDEYGKRRWSWGCRAVIPSTLSNLVQGIASRPDCPEKYILEFLTPSSC